MLDLKQIKKLRLGDTLYEHGAFHADGTPRRWRVNGQLRVKKRTGAFQLPIKHGLRDYDYITEQNFWHFSLTEHQARKPRYRVWKLVAADKDNARRWFPIEWESLVASHSTKNQREPHNMLEAAGTYLSRTYRLYERTSARRPTLLYCTEVDNHHWSFWGNRYDRLYYILNCVTTYKPRPVKFASWPAVEAAKRGDWRYLRQLQQSLSSTRKHWMLGVPALVPTYVVRKLDSYVI